MVAFEQDVVGLDVAVDDPAAWAESRASATCARSSIASSGCSGPRRSAASGRRRRSAASRRSARRPPRGRRRPGRRSGARGWPRAATRAGSGRGSSRRCRGGGRSPSAPPGGRGRDGWRGRRHPSHRARSARRAGSRASVEPIAGSPVPPPSPATRRLLPAGWCGGGSGPAARRSPGRCRRGRPLSQAPKPAASSLLRPSLTSDRRGVSALWWRRRPRPGGRRRRRPRSSRVVGDWVSFAPGPCRAASPEALVAAEQERWPSGETSSTRPIRLRGPRA